jgi:hypothetical protein
LSFINPRIAFKNHSMELAHPAARYQSERLLRRPASLSLKRRAVTWENIMIIKSTLIGATAIAIALTSFDLGPAKAGEGGTQVNSYKQSDEISAARKRRGYRTNPAVPLAAFGAIIGTIGAVAAANSRRDYYAPGYYEEPVSGGYSGGPAYGYAGPRAYHYQQAPVYQRHYGAPAQQGRDYYSRWGGSGGQPGYRGPNVNVPGATNYGNAAGQNGQAPPVVPPSPTGGAL